VVGGGLCGGFGAGRAGGVWGVLLGGEKGVRGLPLRCALFGRPLSPKFFCEQLFVAMTKGPIHPLS
jgi:hypothetical protein